MTLRPFDNLLLVRGCSYHCGFLRQKWRCQAFGSLTQLHPQCSSWWLKHWVTSLSQTYFLHVELSQLHLISIYIHVYSWATYPGQVNSDKSRLGEVELRKACKSRSLPCNWLLIFQGWLCFCCCNRNWGSATLQAPVTSCFSDFSNEVEQTTEAPNCWEDFAAPFEQTAFGSGSTPAGWAWNGLAAPPVRFGKALFLSIFHREMLWDDVTVVVDVGKRLKTQVCSNRIGLGRDQHQLQSKWAARLIAFVSLLLWGQQDTGIYTRTAGIPNLLAKPSPQSWWTSIKANISFLETLADLLLFQLRVLGRNTSKATYRASTLESLRLVRLEQNLGMEIISAWPCYQMTSDVYGNLTT